MAERIVVNGVGEILNKLISMATEEIGLAWNVKKDLEKLVCTMTAIQALLHDAEKQQEEQRTVRLFLRRLRDVAYAAEDVLDEFGYQTTRLKVANQVSRLFSHLISPAFRLMMAHKIKNINNEFDEIRRNMDSFNFVRASIPTALENRKTIETFSFVDESEVVGRDDEKSVIVSMLTTSDNQDILSVLPIVGMGGLGKTTLAKLVYNDGLVKKYFDKRIWVHVSKDFDIKKILTDITESITNRTCQVSSIDVIQRNLKDELDDKRFLLVLDDIWNDNLEQWHELKSSLKIGTRGSIILATTRLGEVASMIGTLRTHQLKCLAEDQCWSILKNKAFGNGGAEETPNMVAIGKEIVRKCGGVPLAAKALGGLMHVKKDEQGWLSIRDSEIWALPMGKDGILPALKLSYDNLPSPLKQCFLYCSTFPKGTRIFRRGLIQHWMALGFLQPSTEDEPMEDIGIDYVNYLVWNSFFQDVEKDDVHGIKSFKMHDLVYDLARSLSIFDNIVVGVEELKNKSDVLHLRLYIEGDINLNLIQEGLCKMRKLRSLHLDCTKTRTPICSNVLDILFRKLKHLHVLHLNGCMIQKLPSSIKKLKYLRHLNLNSNPIEVLPASITVLYHLQSLHLLNCPLRELPQDMKNLINLRQLVIYQKDRCLSQMPINMGRLHFLDRLSTFVVGHKKGQSIKELQRLDLRYRLRLLNLENVKSRGEAEEANLIGKKKLNWLELIWGSHTSSGYMLENDKKKTLVAEEDVLEGLRPHPNLKRLNIHNYGGVNFPGWMMSGCDSFLPNLVELFLTNCGRLECVPPLGQLPSLKVLELKGVKRMKRLGTEFYHDEGSNYNPQAVAAINTTTTALFPSLEVLYLGEMLNLEEWVEPPQQRQGGFVIPSFPRLEKIVVEDCPKLMIMPTQFPSLKLLQIIKSNGIVLSSVTKVPSLTTLEILEVPKLKFLAKGLLHCTVTLLNIRKCPDLEAIIMPSEEEEGVEVQALPSSLEDLQIGECPSLTSLPNLHGLQSIRKLYFLKNEKISRLPEDLHTLRTLEKLSIGGYSSELESFPSLEPLQHLPSLRCLIITGWSKLTSFPEQLQCVTQLEVLGIYEFNSVAALPEWLGNLSSLRRLCLEECNNLMNLPKEGGLRCFTALETLVINSCPLLKERCSKERGEEWPKIKHIPYIQIDGSRYV